MKKTILGAVAALILFLVLLLALAPAKVITPWVSDAVPGLHLHNVEGSIWSAKIDRGQFRNFTLDNIELDVNPLSLVVGKLNAGVVVNDPNINIEADTVLSAQHYQLENVRFDIDTSYVISKIRTPLQGLSGRIEGALSELDFENNHLKTLEGQGEWRNAVIQYPNNNLELGDINFKLSKMSNQGNGAKVDIMSNQGVLDLKGYIEIGLDKQFIMNIHTTTELPANIKNWLTQWGRKQSDRIYLEWRGRLP